MNTILRPTADTKEFLGGHRVRLAREISNRSVGAYSVTPDRWPRIHGAWFRQTFQGTRHIRRYPARAGGACATFHGVGHHSDRTARRPSHTSRWLRVPGQFADGRAFVGGYSYCAFALWIQFDHAPGRDSIRRTVWAGGL